MNIVGNMAFITIYSLILNLILGTMGPECGSRITHNRGSLYCIDSNLKPVKKVSPVSVSNGIAWNKDNTIMYYIDSPTRRIVAFNYDPLDGTICKIYIKYYNYMT